MKKQANVIDRKYTYAVVGASNNKAKYGYKVLKDLNEAGFEVVPVNPKEKEILGLKVAGSLFDTGRKIDVAVFVVPPEITENIIREIIERKSGIDKVWMQPGSESEEAIRSCREKGITCIHGTCIMVEKMYALGLI